MRYISILVVFFIASPIFAQNTDFQEYLKREQQKREEYMKKEIDNFNQFVELYFKEFETFRTSGLLLEPKPQVQPIAPQNSQIPGGNIYIKPILDDSANPGDNRMLSIIRPNSIQLKLPSEDIVSRPVDSSFAVQDDLQTRRSSDQNRDLEVLAREANSVMNLDFCTSKLSFFLDQILIDDDIVEADSKSIKKAIEGCNVYVNQINNLSYQVAETSSILKLNDYGQMMLGFDILNKALESNNKAMLVTWLIAVDRGYDCKLAYSRSGVLYILANTDERLLWTTYVTSNDKRYYMLPLGDADYDKSGLFTYNDEFEEANVLVKMGADTAVDIMSDYSVKNYELDSVKIGLKANISVVDYSKRVPILDYVNYFKTPMSKMSEQSLLVELAPRIKRLSPKDKVAFIYSFVQKNFKYMLDKESFGAEERPQTPEEFLFYGYGDCEDFSAFFAYLVHSLTGYETLGLVFSNHITTAINIPGMDGGYRLGGEYKDYVICDPTYFGAKVGDLPNKYRSESPKILKIN